jgi:DNA-binding Lrp family transcriptional regulator
MDAVTARLLNEFQRGFPLVPRPFESVAARLGTTAGEVLARLASLVAGGEVSRVGVTFAPGRVGAATLAAMAVPRERLDEVAARVSAFAEVNHNYEREHSYNLWFVVTAADAARVEAVVREIERNAACGTVLSLPLIEAYHLDLGFDLHHRGSEPPRARGGARARGRVELTAAERALVAALEDGLPLTEEPYAEVARRAGMPEAEAMRTLARWIEERVVNRLGVIVRHRALGFRANAMVVWDVPDAEAAAVGERIAGWPEVSLCYRRRRLLPAWRYNLYCMIHGRDRLEVRGEIAAMDARLDLVKYPYEVLFSRRCFKQRGARYATAAPVSPGRTAEAAGREPAHG